MYELYEKKKYIAIRAQPYFCPVAIETSGVCGPQSLTLPKELGKRIVHTTGDHNASQYVHTTGDHNASQYIWQQLSIAIQRENAASILGCMPHIDELVYIYYNIHVYCIHHVFTLI